MKVLVHHGRRLLQALGLRWKIAVLLAVGCALVAVTIGVLIHEARVRQVSDVARKSATEQLIRVRQVYELTGLPTSTRSGRPTPGSTAPAYRRRCARRPWPDAGPPIWTCPDRTRRCGRRGRSAAGRS